MAESEPCERVYFDSNDDTLSIVGLSKLSG